VTERKARGNKRATGKTGTPELAPAVRQGFSLLTEDDIYLFNEGSHFKMWEKWGAHPAEVEGETGVQFAVWAPDAEAISVIGDFNAWDRASHPLRPRGSSGIWEGFIPGLGKGSIYKYWIASRHHGYRVEKADPLALHAETPPKTASIVWELEYEWGDGDWMAERRWHNSLDAPISIYELHLGSWRRGEDGRWLTYRELAPLLAEYVRDMGYTHVEFMPVMEHPFYGSWGYQITGYFAPTSRYGAPEDFAYLVDYLHQQGVGVILDWAPSHFPNDEHGLGYFDGTHLYEHADPRKGFHPDWASFIFNYGRNEVRSFLISSAMFWLDKYHVDGLRVDAVASMLYLDYSRKEGEWIPNQYGGRENLEAVSFLRRFNSEAYGAHPGIQTIAEESTAWPGVSRPTYIGGLGFGLKWDMGWMHDTLKYISLDPIHRQYHHNELTFRMIYAFTENFVLSLSHDEVVHGKGSLISKMPGDDWQKAANLRLLLAYMTSQPGKKLMFMGGEFGQWEQWDHESSLSWDSLNWEFHQQMQRCARDLNHLYRSEPALHEIDLEPGGFEWIDASDYLSSVLSYLRKAKTAGEQILAVCNFTPVPRYNYRVGAPRAGFWRELFNSDAAGYGGSGHGNMGGAEAVPAPYHGRPYSLNLTLPPLGAVFLKPGAPGR
jgi:1,4-alpha-glucan branching enzyme